MAKTGGARAGAGRPINPNSLRQANLAEGKAVSRGTDGSLTLPATYDAGAPPWPLPAHETGEDGNGVSEALNERELAVWADLWTRPQAWAWNENHLAYEVGIYVRLMVSGETGDTKALAEARQRGDKLGMTPDAMARLGWRISDTDSTGLPSPTGRTGQAKPKSTSSMRDRLKVVQGGG